MSVWSKTLRLWPWLAAVCTGLLCGGCFAPFNQWWLCWIALTPLLSAVWFSGQNSRRRGLRDFLLGYVSGVIFFWTVFFWLRTVTVPGWFMVGLYLGLYFGFWSWIAGRLRPTISATAPTTPGGGPNESFLSRSPWLRSSHNLLLAFVLACAWVTQEALRSVIFSGWGWNTLGSALHGQWALIQITELTGVPGLSFLTAFANVIAIATVRRFILEAQVHKMRAHFDLTLTMSAIVGVMAYGIHALQVHRPSKPLRVALVQANIPREHKFSPEFAHTIFEQFQRLSSPAVESTPRPDIVIWPESSMPGPVLGDQASYDFVMNFSSNAKTDLLLGTIDFDDTGAVYNAAILVSEGGKRTQLYRKMHLVPFGEYIPGRHFVPLLAQIVGNQVPDDFAFGKEHTVFSLTNGGTKIAPLICFEDTIGELTRQFVRRGAVLLANVTNDGWFLRSAGSQQHIANAVFRCVETRRPMVCAANTGVTCFINEFGRITNVLLDDHGSQFTEGVLTGEANVPIDPEMTFYVQHGEVFAQGCMAATALTFLYLIFRWSRRRSVRRGGNANRVPGAATL
ncbi:MAG: apolipoprotein N-acyltransferase [Verrucomicrobiota bacterium]|nr:apolipoprotein N-acyltransferase [Verrucomicrobiota bacterium]